MACRTAAEAGAVAVLCLAFPLHPPGRPEKSRLEELDGVEVPTLVVQGTKDPFGMPPPGPDREVVEVQGDHGLKADLGALGAAVDDWLPARWTALVPQPRGLEGRREVPAPFESTIWPSRSVQVCASAWTTSVALPRLRVQKLTEATTASPASNSSSSSLRDESNDLSETAKSLCNLGRSPAHSRVHRLAGWRTRHPPRRAPEKALWRAVEQAFGVNGPDQFEVLRDTARPVSPVCSTRRSGLGRIDESSALPGVRAVDDSYPEVPA